jgi:hypothetical protein
MISTGRHAARHGYRTEGTAAPSSTANWRVSFASGFLDKPQRHLEFRAEDVGAGCRRLLALMIGDSLPQEPTTTPRADLVNFFMPISSDAIKSFDT